MAVGRSMVNNGMCKTLFPQSDPKKEFDLAGTTFET